MSRARCCPPLPPNGSMLGWSKGHVRMQKRDLFSLRFGSPETRLNIDPPGGGGEQNLTQLKIKRDFISQTPDPTKPMLEPMRPRTRHISLLTLLLNFPCASGMRTIRASECYKLGRPNVHNSNARMCTTRAAEETWGGASVHTSFGRPSVHHSGAQVCTLRASECAHLGRPIVHTSGLRICTVRTSERAQLGRPNMHTSGAATCIFRASEGAHFRRPSVHSSGVRTFTRRTFECALFRRPNVQNSCVRVCAARASELAQFGRPKVQSLHARTCTSPPRNVAA